MPLWQQGFSSHQFEVSIETKISTPSEVQAVSANICNTLRSAVDEQIQQVGFMPDEQYGKQGHAPAPSGYHQDNADSNAVLP